MAHKPPSDRSDLRRRGPAPFVTRSAMNDGRRGKSRWDFCDIDGTTRQGHRIDILLFKTAGSRSARIAHEPDDITAPPRRKACWTRLQCSCCL
jgi:hypothetical protein